MPRWLLQELLERLFSVLAASTWSSCLVIFQHRDYHTEDFLSLKFSQPEHILSHICGKIHYFLCLHPPKNSLLSWFWFSIWKRIVISMVHDNRLYGFWFGFEIKCNICWTTVSGWHLEYKPEEAWTKPCSLRFSAWLVSAWQPEPLIPVEKKWRKSHPLSLWVRHPGRCHLLPSKQYSTT